MSNLAYILILIGVAAVVFIIAFLLGIFYRKNTREKQIGSATQEATRIINNALSEAETAKKTSLIEAKDEIHRLRSEADKEIRERHSEVQRQETRLNQKEENLDKKTDALEKKTAALNEKLQEQDQKLLEIDSMKKSQFDILEKISGYTKEQAKEQLLKTFEETLNEEKGRRVLENEQMIRDQSEVIAREIVGTAIQRCAVDLTAEATVSVVQLTNDDMKGRIIGREGRNIRSIESITGTELIIDDTPECITISSFDPVRREIARRTLERLVADGRIHPAKIEEMFDKSTKEVEAIIKSEGEKAVMSANCGSFHPELVKLLGKLKFRTSYGQNVLQHSMEVSFIVGLMAAEIGADERLARRAGLLHDIGKALDHEMEGSHVALGVQYARKYKESEKVISAIKAHHGEVECKSITDCLVQAADAISASRPGARREDIENYIQRLQQLEEISEGFDGVEKAYAMQAGREVRVMVVPEKINDEKMPYIAREIAEKVESTLEYPGQIKINIIRESRVSDVAK